jgi:hypothetical protein
MTIGTRATSKFFMRRKNVKVSVHGNASPFHALDVVLLQGSSFFLGGAFLVVIGWTIIGLLVEAYGFWLLFSGFFPTVLQFFRRVPLLGKVLDLPILKTVSSVQLMELVRVHSSLDAT